MVMKVVTWELIKFLILFPCSLSLSLFFLQLSHLFLRLDIIQSILHFTSKFGYGEFQDIDSMQVLRNI